MPHVRLITGTARSGRAAAIDTLLSEAPERSLLIVPTEQHARRRTRALLEAAGRDAMLDPPVITFDGLVRRILRGTQHGHARIEVLEQHLLLKRAVARVRKNGALDPLGDAADTEGFLDHLLSVIAQLKQAAIEPDAFRRRLKSARRNHPVDRVVTEVYDAYQEELQRAKAVDLQGMYWLARDACEKKRPLALAHIETLLLDEFDDFTPSEFRVVEGASRHVERIVFGLNCDEGPAQRNLYALPIGTAKRIREAFGDGVATLDLPEPAPGRATEFIASTLLIRDDRPVPAALEMNIEFVACHTIDHEIETIARRIKRLVREKNAPLQSIALVWRDPSGAAEAVAQTFAEFGIPVSGVADTTPAQCAIGGFLLHFIEAAQTCPAPAMTDLLTSPWFAGPGARHTDTFATLIRAARPQPERGSWRTSTGRLAARTAKPGGAEIEKLARNMPAAAAAAAALQDAVTRFFALAGLLPASATVSSHAAALDAVLDALPIANAIASLPDETDRSRETAALDAIRRVLVQLVESDGAIGGGRMPLSDFAPLLRRTFSLQRVVTPEQRGAVVCLGMEAARYLEFDHVFLAGMTDGDVPARPPVNALYGEDERSELRALDVPLEDTKQHDRREMLLFQRMFAVARRGMTISWHGVDRGGRTAQRSLYLEELAERLPQIRVHRPVTPREALVPPPELAACARDVRNLAFAEAVSKAAATRFPEIAIAARIELARQDFGPCGAHDAMLQAAKSLAALAADYGPATQFSATALESYAGCPFHFFQDRVLRLFTIEPVQQTLDRRVEGSVLHGALERFHRAHCGKAVAEIPEEDAAAAMREALDAAFTRATQGYAHLSKGLLAAEKAKLARLLRQYLAIAREKDDPRWKPAMFETAFGRARDDAGATLPPYRLALDGEEVLITGRIDRVDESGGAIRLIDYKSSKVETKEITDKRVFQLALYALAAESVVQPGAQCDSAVYLAVGKDKGETAALARGGRTPVWDDRVARAREAVAAAVAGIRAGRFHPTLHDEACKGCAAERVCRFERARMQRKAGP